MIIIMKNGHETHFVPIKIRDYFQRCGRPLLRVTLPRFYRHLHKGENGEIGGDYVSRNPTSVYRGL